MTNLVVVINVVKLTGLEVGVNEENNGFGGRGQCGESDGLSGCDQ